MTAEIQLSDALAPAETSDLWEYLLVVPPTKNVRDTVGVEKAWFAQTYGHALATIAKPHIAIAGFLASESLEEPLVRWMQNIVQTQKCFSVTLNNFGRCAPHTICLTLENPHPLTQLACSLHAVTDDLLATACTPLPLNPYPHIAIASGLPPHAYQKAWPHYKAKKYNHSFVVSELHLLKQRHQYDKSRLATTFHLSPDQLCLFN